MRYKSIQERARAEDAQRERHNQRKAEARKQAIAAGHKPIKKRGGWTLTYDRGRFFFKKMEPKHEQ
jgi:hypothetical protein